MHWILVALIGVLAVGSLRNGAKLQAMRRRDNESRRLLLVEEARQARLKGGTNWFAAARRSLEEARHLRADHDLRNEWIRCLARENDSTGGTPTVCRGLVLPVSLRRDQSVALEFSGDNSRLIGIMGIAGSRAFPVVHRRHLRPQLHPLGGHRKLPPPRV